MLSRMSRITLAAWIAAGLGLPGAIRAQETQNAAPTPEAAAPAADKREGIEEIIVTGTKRAQASQDVPIAITAISEAMIENQFRTDVLQLGEMTPGVALGQVAGFRAIAGGVRGTGQNSILVTQDSSVVLLVDEFALSNVQAQFVELFDVERVEIYRGPQGTLFGKSATGGAISIVTKRPDLEAFGADLQFEYGTFSGDGVPNHARIQKYRAAVNVPIIEGTLAMRATAILDRDGGYYTNDKATATFPGGRTVGSGEKINNTDVLAGKIKLLWQPIESYEAYFMFDYLNDDSGSPPGVNESEPGMLLPLIGFPSIHQAGLNNVYSTGITNQCFEGNPDGLCLTAGHRVDVEGYLLHQTLTLDKVTLKAITGWRNQEEILPSTYTGEAYASLFDASRNTTKRNTQVELRASTTFDGPFNLVGGFVWSRDQTNMLAYATVGLLTVLTGNPAFQTDPTMGGARQDRKTTAFYADGTYDITERLSFTAGLRWTKDKKDFFRRANPGGPCTALTPLGDQVPWTTTTIDHAGCCASTRGRTAFRVSASASRAKDLKPFDIPLPDSAFDIASRGNDSWDEITYRLVVDYKLTDDSLAYFSYATGFIPAASPRLARPPATCNRSTRRRTGTSSSASRASFSTTHCRRTRPCSLRSTRT